MSTEPNVRPSTLHLPQGPWTTVLDCLCAHFPAIDRATWLDRMARGRVTDGEGRPVDALRPYQVGLCVRYYARWHRSARSRSRSTCSTRTSAWWWSTSRTSCR